MGKQKKFRGLIALLTIALVVTSMSFPQLGFAQAQSGSEVQHAQVAQAGQSIPQKQNFSSSIRQTWGVTDTNAGIFIESHASKSTKTYAFGSKLPVTFHCYDKSYHGNYIGYLTIWDEVKQAYLQTFSTPILTSYDGIWQGTFDLSKLTVSTGRYQVQTLLYDSVSGQLVAYDYFSLNISNLTVPTVAVAASGPHSLKISWTTPYYGASYRVYKATTASGTYAYVGQTSSKSYNCSGLVSGKTYYFKVKPYVTYGTTTKYGTLSASKSGIPRPLAPIVTVSSVSYTSQKISWKAISGANGYYIYRATSSTGTYAYLGSTTSLTKTYTGLVTGKNYYYKIKAYHTESNGTKIYSSYSSVKYGKPVPVTPNVDVGLSAYDSVKVTWTGVTGASGYEIYRGLHVASQSYATLQYVGAASSSARSYNDAHLKLETDYEYAVLAYHTENGVKIYSLTPKQLNIGIDMIMTSGIPTFKPAYATATEIKISWNEIWGAHYEIWKYDVTKPELGYVYLALCNTSPPSYTDTGLEPGNQYRYKVRTYRVEGTQKIYSPNIYSDVVNTVLQAPKIGLTIAYPDRIGFDWNSEWFDVSTGFIIERSTDNINFVQIANQLQTGSTQCYYDYDIVPGQIYYYRMKGYYKDLSVTSDWSNVIWCTIPLI
jgi:hypothetical protein